MKGKFWLTTVLLTTLAIPVGAENLNDLSKLLSTKQCPNCDLVGSGLVMASLKNANLKGANLSHANLSQANLMGADLSGADLSGTSLYGADLSGANLSGAILNGTDLRNAYLTGADLTGTNLNTAYVEGTIGLPEYVGSASTFYAWGIKEAQRGNYQGALKHFNSSVEIDPQFAPGYLGRSLTYFRLGNDTQANQDALTASNLFEKQQNPQGYQAAQQLIQGMEIARQRGNVEMKDPGPDVVNLFQTLTSIVLPFFLP